MGIPDIEKIERERRARVESQLHHQHIPHYYGDSIRWLFVAAAVLLFIGMPTYPDVLPFGTAASITFGILLILFGALTNPHKQWVIVGDAVIAGLGVIVVEIVTIEQYAFSSGMILAFREALALALLIALYQALKTVRAMWMHKIGRGGTHFGEFHDAE